MLGALVLDPPPAEELAHEQRRAHRADRLEGQGEPELVDIGRLVVAERTPLGVLQVADLAVAKRPALASSWISSRAGSRLLTASSPFASGLTRPPDVAFAPDVVLRDA